ncbi:MAG: ABC transporter substrate-binding protein [Bacteroidia bacterium]|nr:ABC transporter substrate-binding protein [Bacteroidia bacterium]
MRYIFRNLHVLFTDQLNNTIELKTFPKRIISIVPSQSELLWDLGLREELVGITKFCIHPSQMFNSVERVGGTKTLNLEKIRALKPDLIIGNKEENEQSQILELQKEFPVWMSDIYTLHDALQMMEGIGALVNKRQEAETIKSTIQTSFLNLPHKPQSVLYLIWNKPYMAAGKATFIGDMLSKIGLQNVTSRASATDNMNRYPELSIEDINALNPDLIFLSSEPYPFKQEHMDELQQHLPASKIILVDGELFSWYGSRLAKSAAYFQELMRLI